MAKKHRRRKMDKERQARMIVWILGGILLVCVLVGVVASFIGDSHDHGTGTGATNHGTGTTHSTGTTNHGTGATVPGDKKENLFVARIVEKGADWLLVEPEQGSTLTGQVRVVTEKTAAFAVGDWVVVTHTGQVMPSMPPQVIAVHVQKMH